MHRLGIRNAEVAVISDDLIKKTVLSEIDPTNTNAINENEQTIEFAKLETLSLSFKNIFKMDNLETLKNLIKLQLDNNVIQEIEGIGHLIHLQWLDLSFNNIQTIKGLETLVQLTDLSLYNNNISKIEGLDTLKKLQVLSLGNNSLTTTEGLLYLKCLPSLRVLNLSGNPVTSDPEYRSFVLAHMEKLHYLDYSLVDVNEAGQAREQYQDELEELKEVKAIEDAALAREADHVKYLSMLKEANIIILETLITDMFKEDTEMSKIEILPGLRNLIDDYTEKGKTSTEEIKLILLEKHALLTKEMNLFQQKYHKLQQDAQQASIQATEIYRRTVKNLLKKASTSTTSTSNTNQEQAIQALHEAEVLAEKLYQDLMNHESDLVEIVQELILSMEVNIENISTQSREISTEHFRAIEVLENNFFESVSRLAVTLLERMASEDGEEDDFLTDECRAILNDRDALNNAINGSHDIHIGKLLAQEDLMREQRIAKITEIVKQAKDQEWSRNRSRVAEIIHIKTKNTQEISKIRDELNHTEDEFY